MKFGHFENSIPFLAKLFPKLQTNVRITLCHELEEEFFFLETSYHTTFCVKNSDEIFRPEIRLFFFFLF